MAIDIRRIDYFYTSVEDEPGRAYELLSILKESGIDLEAFAAVPVGPSRTQLTLFPRDSSRFEDRANRSGMKLDGPHPALLVQGDDELGALADFHSRLYEAGVNVYASSGVTDGSGRFGYVVYVGLGDFDRAAAALGV